MKITEYGAEYPFLTFMESLKFNPSGWIACTFGFSKLIDHREMVERRAFIKGALSKLELQSFEFLTVLLEETSSLPQCHIYRFTDNDIILLCCPKNEMEQREVQRVLEKVTAKLPKNLCDYGFLTKEMQVFSRIADHKLLTRKKMEAYEALSDRNFVETIPLRRKKRDEPLILIVEDDRFTAAYTQNFLKDYDTVLARNGEEAILYYIENAPDAVFLDIHLPGLNGHEVLAAIKSADPDAFVVMQSVDTAKASILDAWEHGATTYLKKPFSRERLLNSLRLSPFIQESHKYVPVLREKR